MTKSERKISKNAAEFLQAISENFQLNISLRPTATQFVPELETKAFGSLQSSSVIRLVYLKAKIITIYSFCN